MNYQCPFCCGEFAADDNAESVQCPHCNETVELVPTEEPPVSDEPQPEQPQPPIGLFEAGPSGKSRGVAALLALTLGVFGAHYFYLGKPKAGVINIVANILLLMVVARIVDIIVSIRMFQSTQEEFEERYVYTDALYPF